MLCGCDFCEQVRGHEQFFPSADVLICSTVLTFNRSYAFSAELNQMILAKFLDLKEGAKVRIALDIDDTGEMPVDICYVGHFAEEFCAWRWNWPVSIPAK